MMKKNNPSGYKNILWGIKVQEWAIKSITTFILAAGAVVILIPFGYMITTSLKDQSQLRSDPLSFLPRKPVFSDVNGKQEPTYEVTVNGATHLMALIKNIPGKKGLFVDPDRPDVMYELLIDEQRPLYVIDFQWRNYQDAVESIPFWKYLGNTLTVTFVGMIGMLFSCTLVAYGFSRFRARWLNILFLVLLSTLMLPSQVRLIPIYVLFQKLGWIDTLLPLIVPQFFANAYDVFMLRQFFMTIPLEMDDAARMDGANSLQILFHILIPQARPAILAVSIFHFLYAWNDFYEPLIFLHNRANWTLAVGLQTFDALYSVNTHLIMAISLIMVIPPVLIFFLSQKVFTQGVVFKGIK